MTRLLRCEGSVAMIADAGERAKGEVAEGGGGGHGESLESPRPTPYP